MICSMSNPVPAFNSQHPLLTLAVDRVTFNTDPRNQVWACISGVITGTGGVPTATGGTGTGTTRGGTVRTGEGEVSTSN